MPDKDSSGHLRFALVYSEFWPACRNCKHFAKCLNDPVHPAFPHRWEWGYRAVNFGNSSMLVLESWVGTADMGHAHTGCYSYAINPDDVYPLEPYHIDSIAKYKRYIELDKWLLEAEHENESHDVRLPEEYYDRHNEWTNLYREIFESGR